MQIRQNSITNSHVLSPFKIVFSSLPCRMAVITRNINFFKWKIYNKIYFKVESDVILILTCFNLLVCSYISIQFGIPGEQLQDVHASESLLLKWSTCTHPKNFCLWESRLFTSGFPFSYRYLWEQSRVIRSGMPCQKIYMFYTHVEVPYSDFRSCI